MASLEKQYIEIVKKSLLNELYIENEAKLIYTFGKMMSQEPLIFEDYFNINRIAPDLLRLLTDLKLVGGRIVFQKKLPNGELEDHEILRNITELSHTMVGRKRLDNLENCIETVLNEHIPGDFIETGIWRGGACIFMRAVLKAYNVTDRTVWCADSFEGVPPPSLPQDNGFDMSANFLPVLAVSLEEVQSLFSRYDLLDEHVKFIKGWFKDTLHKTEINRLAILRLDGDLYESTMDALQPLYSKVSKGGFVIVDDYFSCKSCKLAVDEFRTQHRIDEPLEIIDNASVFWRK